MAIGDLYQVKLYCRAAEQIGINVLNYRTVAEAGTGATIGQLAAGAVANLAASIKACVSASAEYLGLSIQKVSPAPVGAIQYSVSGAGGGDVAGDLLPRQASGIITLQTTFAGRRFRGRTYVPFPSETSSDTNGIPTNAYVTLLTTHGTNLLSFISGGVAGNTSDLAPVVRSLVGAVSTLIVSFTARQKWATQRRRGSYGAPNVSPF